MSEQLAKSLSSGRHGRSRTFSCPVLETGALPPAHASDVHPLLSQRVSPGGLSWEVKSQGQGNLRVLLRTGDSGSRPSFLPYGDTVDKPAADTNNSPTTSPLPTERCTCAPSFAQRGPARPGGSGTSVGEGRGQSSLTTCLVGKPPLAARQRLDPSAAVE
jgi:hypothetical protein